MYDNQIFSVHVELQFVPKEGESTINVAANNELRHVTTTRLREVSYHDSYYDTNALDLHTGGLLLRARRRQKKLEFFDYKGLPTYFGPLHKRPFATQEVDSESTLSKLLRAEAVSWPIQALYNERPDLLGKPLTSVADTYVDKVTFDISLSPQNRPVGRLSFHKYKYSTSMKRSGTGLVCELQPPYGMGQNINSSMFLALDEIANRLEDQGFIRSPSTKYHRISREEME